MMKLLLILCLLMLPLNLNAGETTPSTPENLETSSVSHQDKEIIPYASQKPIHTAWDGKDKQWEDTFYLTGGFYFYKIDIKNFSSSPIRITVRKASEMGSTENEYVLGPYELHSISRFHGEKYGNRTRHIRVQTTDGGPLSGEVGVRIATNWNDMG